MASTGTDVYLPSFLCTILERFLLTALRPDPGLGHEQRHDREHYRPHHCRPRPCVVGIFRTNGREKPVDKNQQPAET